MRKLQERKKMVTELLILSKSMFIVSKGNKLVLLLPYDRMQESNSFKW